VNENTPQKVRRRQVDDLYVTAAKASDKLHDLEKAEQGIKSAMTKNKEERLRLRKVAKIYKMELKKVREKKQKITVSMLAKITHSAISGRTQDCSCQWAS